MIHVKRDRDICIASLHNHMMSDPLVWDGYVSPVDTSRPTTHSTYDAAPPTAALLGEMDDESWNRLSLDDRIAWMYDTSHRMIEENLHLFSDAMEVTTDELDDPAAIQRIAHFLNPAWRQSCPPVHLNHVLRNNNEPAQSEVRNPKQLVLADFDLHQMRASDTYPVVYFMQHMVTALNSVDRDAVLADLGKLRGEIDALIATAEGRSLSVRPQRREGTAPNLRLAHEATMSPAKTALLDDYFGDFETAKLEKSPAYPVIYFLQRLLTLRDVTGDGDPDLAMTYHFMNQQVDDLIQKANSSP